MKFDLYLTVIAEIETGNERRESKRRRNCVLCVEHDPGITITRNCSVLPVVFHCCWVFKQTHSRTFCVEDEPTGRSEFVDNQKAVMFAEKWSGWSDRRKYLPKNSSTVTETYKNNINNNIFF